VLAVLSGTPFAVSHVTQPLDSIGSYVVAAAPVRDAAGKISGALVISLDFNNPNIRAFSHPIGLGQTGYMDLVAQDGKILASTRPGRVGGESDHGFSLMGMIRDHRQSVSACHDCHTTPASAGPLTEVLAFAPLDKAQWGITVRQSEAEVFGLTRSLQDRIFGLMLLTLAGALVLVYFTTRSVIVPVQALTEATRRIAEGDLDSPIKTRGQDEVGVLAHSFDEMRVRLKQSAEEIQAWNRELDARVQERTAAYEAAARENARLYAELSRKEQSRGELLRRVISAQEDERKRIARELHDETSQGLTALMIGFDTVQMASAQDVQKANGHLRNCKAIASNLLTNIHRLIADLRPSLLDDLGLVPAIAWYGEQRLKPLGIDFHMSEHGFKTRLPPSIETALFRIVQEAMTNVVRHSHATSVNVQFTRQDGHVILQVSDDGRGFDPQALLPSEGQGLGLRGMQERASILGGEFQMQTTPGKGTVITVRVPVPEEASHVENPRAYGR
jgi:signal transduction histidine kinase